MYQGEIISYIDSDSLLGSCPNPTPVSDGNPITLCALSVCIDSSKESKVNTILTIGIANLESQKYRGIWNKKARSEDQVTHDDLIGLVAFSYILDKPFHRDLVMFGQENNWVLSNTGKWYWTAWAKPWHRAFYKLCAGIKINIFESLMLSATINMSSLNGTNSGRQLTWLMVKCFEKMNRFESACKYFRKKVDMKKVFSEYHGVGHPFEKYYTGQ